MMRGSATVATADDAATAEEIRAISRRYLVPEDVEGYIAPDATSRASGAGTVEGMVTGRRRDDQVCISLGLEVQGDGPGRARGAVHAAGGILVAGEAHRRREAGRGLRQAGQRRVRIAR